MTETEYLARRERIVKQLAAPQSMSQGDTAMTFRSAADLTRALKALDAEWQRSQGTASLSIGRIYRSGEGL